ncbi:MAG: GntR family transcriptional regulator [Thermogemmatispora sp.]|nr:GntR family transcriptional regulator [Thermogemmatispora sp.]MBE3567812.1 GntR family transcriptional regulator [Thermogemmatispora sp.]
MRGPTPEQLLRSQPPRLRASSKTDQAYLDLREQILRGTYQPGQQLVPRAIAERYQLNNTSVQLILLRLASEGLIKIVPIKEHRWPYNAAQDEYHVAALDVRTRLLSTRQGGFVSDLRRQGQQPRIEVEEIKVIYADEEVARLLALSPGEKVIMYRQRQWLDAETLMALSETYLPFWMAELLPELEAPDCDLYLLMRRLGKQPYWCTEAVDVVHASSLERVIFGLSPNDPCPLLKLTRRVFDRSGEPLSVDFLTDRADLYRLHYSFPLYPEDVPEPFREQER